MKYLPSVGIVFFFYFLGCLGFRRRFVFLFGGLFFFRDTSSEHFVPTFPSRGRHAFCLLGWGLMVWDAWVFAAGLFFVWRFVFLSRRLIRRLTLGNAAGIFKDNLVPFGANAEGICPKRSRTLCPPSPQGEGIVLPAWDGFSVVYSFCFFFFLSSSRRSGTKDRAIMIRAAAIAR